MKPIRYIISRDKKPNGISNQSNQFAEIFKDYLSYHVIRRWEKRIRGKAHFGFMSFALNRLAPLKKAKGEILHASDFGLIPHISDPIDIVEVWDLIPFKRLWTHQDKLFKSMYYCSFIPGAVKCDQIVVHSKTIQKDVKEYLNRDSLVIPAGVDTHSFRILPNVKKEENSVLCVSGHYEHKNMLNLVESCGLASVRAGDIHLRIVGPIDDKSVSRMNEVAGNFPYLDIEHVGFVSHDFLIELYNLSEIYCSLSMVEGFGLTPIESMACGTIPILSDIPCHKEIAGNYAFYVDGREPEQVADMIFYNLDHEKFYTREMLRTYAEKYDWCNVIPQWVKLYSQYGVEINMDDLL